MNNQIVIPDLHGCVQTLKFAFEDVIKPGKDDEIYFLGDYVNKGPDSKGVIDYILNKIEKGYNIICLKGNHEQLLLNAKNNTAETRFFLEKGGIATLASFKAKDVKDIPVKYYRFLENLLLYVELDKYFLVHAGFDFSLKNPFLNEEAMLTIRDYQADPSKLFNKKIIHGHKAITIKEIVSGIFQPDKFTINLDNGLIYANRKGMGNLVVLNAKDLSYYIIPNLDQ